MLPGMSITIFLIEPLQPASRIIEPLASRCSKFRFTPLPNNSSYARLSQISSAENVSLDGPVVDALISTSQGDLRKAITYLQSASRLSSSTNPPTPITTTDIQEIAGVVPDAVIIDFARTIGVEHVDGDADMEDISNSSQSTFSHIRKKVSGLIREGYSASQILFQVSLLIVFLSKTSNLTDLAA
jgi:replication factor C subunit 2/4